MIRRYLTYFFFAFSISAFCQNGAVYPDVLSTYFYNMSAINPGYVAEEGKADFACGYKFHQGQLQKVSSLSFSAAKIFRNENGFANVLRFTAYNEQEGPYITSPKAYLNYAVSVPIGEEANIYGGVSLGTSGVYFSAPTFTYSAFLPDGGLGLGIKYRKVGLGLSSLQMFNSKANTIGDNYILGRYFTCHFFAEKELGLDWNFKAYGLWRNLPLNGNDFQGTVSIICKETVTLGTSLSYLSGTSFFTAFHLDPSENNLLLALTYNVAPLFTSLPSWRNSFEISLGFRIN